jgi:hypothetical protein
MHFQVSPQGLSSGEAGLGSNERALAAPVTALELPAVLGEFLGDQLFGRPFQIEAGLFLWSLRLVHH